MAIGKTNAQDKSTNYWQVQKIEEADHHFKKNDSGYWVNTNAATGNINKDSAAVCKVFFRMAQTDNITFIINQDSESNYDYGIIGTLDTELDLTSTVDNTVFVLKNFKGVSSGAQTFTTNIPKGEHFVYIKYRKDSSASSGTDTFQFTISSGAIEIEGEEIDLSGVTATAADVLNGIAFIDAEGELVTGTMTNNSDLTSKALSYNSSDKKFYIPYGFYDGNQVATSSQITAIASDVLSGETFMNSSGTLTTGTMANNSTSSTKALTYNSSTGKFYIPTGYYNGNQTPTSSRITATEEDVLQNKYFMNSSGELKSGSIMDVSSAYEFENNYIWLDQEKNSQTVLPGYTSKTGFIAVKAISSTQEIMPTTEAQTIDAGYYNSGFQNWFLTNVTIAGDANLIPENIKSGVSIFGVEGNYKGPRTMTVIIDLSDSNPNTCCTYADDAISMTAKSTEWDEFFGHYPVLLLNGAESKKLNPNNYAQDIDGNSVDITSGDAGDVMVAFPRRGLKLTTSGNILTISFTEEQNNSSFKYYAHQRGSASFDTFYMSAYDGYVDGDGKLRSLSSKTPTRNKTIGAFRTAAQLNGSGYEQFCFFQLLYLQCMYIMKYKSLNGQTALGYGYVSGSTAQTTGTLNTDGLDYGSTVIRTTCMKFAGIENFWGNILKWTDGCVLNSYNAFVTTTTGFNDSGSNYEFTTTGPLTGNISGYMITPQGTSKAGFIVQTVSGSNSTYFSDYASCFPSCVAAFGGNWNGGLDAGPFALSVSYPASHAGSALGARLSFFRR